jgi:hypothetical protein
LIKGGIIKLGTQIPPIAENIITLNAPKPVACSTVLL